MLSLEKEDKVVKRFGAHPDTPSIRCSILHSLHPSGKVCPEKTSNISLKTGKLCTFIVGYWNVTILCRHTWYQRIGGMTWLMWGPQPVASIKFIAVQNEGLHLYTHLSFIRSQILLNISCSLSSQDPAQRKHWWKSNVYDFSKQASISNNLQRPLTCAFQRCMMDAKTWIFSNSWTSSLAYIKS